MSRKYKPALTAEEWTQNRRAGGMHVYNLVEVKDRPGNVIAHLHVGEAVSLHTKDSAEGGSSSWGIDPMTCRALAAVALQAASVNKGWLTWDDVHKAKKAGLNDLAARIAALLPPGGPV